MDDKIFSLIYSSCSEVTKKGYFDELVRFERFIAKPILEAKPSDIIKYFRFIRVGFKQRTINRKLFTIRNFYSRAVKSGFLIKNPIKLMSWDSDAKYNEHRYKKKYLKLTSDDIRNAVGLCKDENVKQIIRLLSTTALKLSEIINLKKIDSEDYVFLNSNGRPYNRTRLYVQINRKFKMIGKNVSPGDLKQFFREFKE